MRPTVTTVDRLLRSAALCVRHPWSNRDATGLPNRGNLGLIAPLTPRQHLAAESLPPCGEDRSNALARLEAVLFVSSQPLSTRKLAQFASLVDGTEARTLIHALNQRYHKRKTAFRVEEVAGGYQLLTRPAFAGWLRRLYQSPIQTRLSAPALETLAVVAYRQPVLRADIEAIRGVQSGEILRQLMDRNLVRITGRSTDLGRPFLYGTTKRFLQLFGLRKLDELPNIETLRGMPGNHPPNSAATTSIPIASTETLEIRSPSQCEEESQVKIRALHKLASDEMLEMAAAPQSCGLPLIVSAKDDDDDAEDEEDDDFDDDEEDDDDLDDDEDDLEEDEWEEVDDDLDEDEFDEEDEWDEEDDWDDDDEEDDDDDDEDEEWEEVE